MGTLAAIAVLVNIDPTLSSTATSLSPSAARLDDAYRAALWRDLVVGARSIVASTSLDASRLFLVRPSRGPREIVGEREEDIARLVGLGYANKQIAAELGIAASSVARGVDKAARLLGLSGRVDLALLVAAVGPHSDGSDCVRGTELAGLGLLVSVALSESALWSRLSEAERSVAQLALAGHRGEAIARLRGDRSARTVANQLAHVFRKAGVSGRTELAARLVGG